MGSDLSAPPQPRPRPALLTLDTHIDIPWPDRGDAFASDTPRCVDLPKMQAGNLRAGCFAAYVPQGPRTPDGYRAAGDRALAMLETINALGRSENGVSARVASTADAIEAAHRDGVLAIIPCVENGHAIGTDLGLLERFRRLGAAYLTISHNGHNLLADSSVPRTDLGDAPTLHGGLSGLGREAVAELNRLGMLVDVSHLSHDAALQAAEASRSPIVATHSCAKALCDVPRNADDALLDAVRQVGGIVSVTAVPSFLRKGGTRDAVTVSDYADHVQYVADRCGITCVGISSDFDGGGGIGGWRNASETGGLVAELARRGWSEADQAAMWSGNFLRVMRQAERMAGGAIQTADTPSLAPHH